MSTALSDCVVRDTLPRLSDEHGGEGVLAQGGAALIAERTLIQGNREDGARSLATSTSETPSRVELTDCVVRDTLPRQYDREGGAGVSAQEGGTLTALRVLIQGSRSAGAYSVTTSTRGTPSRMELRDSVVRSALSRLSDQSHGYGIVAQMGGVMLAERTLIQGNRADGAFSSTMSTGGTPSRVELTNCVVRNTLPRLSDQQGGYGVSTKSGGVLTAIRVLIEDNRSTGVAASGGILILRDIAVLGTLPEESRGVLGVACAAVRGGRIDARRMLAEQSFEGGVMAGGEGTFVGMGDVIIADITPESRRGGFGIAMSGGGRAEFRRLAVLRTHGAALAAVGNTSLIGSRAGAGIVVQDGFIQEIALSAIDYDLSDPLRVTGQPRAFGAYVGLSSQIELHRVLMRGGSVASAAFGGSLGWTDGVASNFSQYFVRGTSVVTPALRLINIVVPGGNTTSVQEDPSVAASFPEPDLGPLTLLESP